MNIFYGHSHPSADSRRAVVSFYSNKQKYVHRVLVKLLILSLPRKSVVRLNDHLDMTIAVDLDIKDYQSLHCIPKEKVPKPDVSYLENSVDPDQLASMQFIWIL